MAASTLEVGKKLVELCQQGKFEEAIKALYSPNIISIEAAAMPGSPVRVEGLAAVIAKTEAWVKGHEVHGSVVTGPWPHGDRFIAYMKMDVTAKAGPMAGHRMTFEESCLYTVKDGKIVQEEFFYSMPG